MDIFARIGIAALTAACGSRFVVGTDNPADQSGGPSTGSLNANADGNHEGGAPADEGTSTGGTSTGTSTTGTSTASSGSTGTGGPNAPPPAKCQPGNANPIDAWIAFDSSHQGNRDIYIVRPDGTDRRRLTADASNEMQPAISPDGRRMAFTSDRGGFLQIFVLSFADGSVVPLTTAAYRAEEAAWSPDSSHLAFHSGNAVYVVGSDGSNPQLVANSTDTFLGGYQSPVFAGNDRVVMARENEIDMANVDGSDLHQVVRNWTTEMSGPSISPSGFDVAYAADCTGQFRVWITPLATIVDPCTGQLASPNDGAEYENAAWGPGPVIAYERNTQPADIVLNDGAGGPACSLTDSNDDDRNPAWSPIGFQPPAGIESSTGGTTGTVDGGGAGACDCPKQKDGGLTDSVQMPLACICAQYNCPAHMSDVDTAALCAAGYQVTRTSGCGRTRIDVTSVLTGSEEAFDDVTGALVGIEIVSDGPALCQANIVMGGDLDCPSGTKCTICDRNGAGDCGGDGG